MLIGAASVACVRATSGARADACVLTKRDSLYLAKGPVCPACAVDKAAVLRSAPPVGTFQAEKSPGCYSAGIDFVVDTLGHPEVWTITIVRTSDRSFANAIMQSIADWRFEPAEVAGRPVRQIVESKHGTSLTGPRRGSVC